MTGTVERGKYVKMAVAASRAESTLLAIAALHDGAVDGHCEWCGTSWPCAERDLVNGLLGAERVVQSVRMMAAALALVGAGKTSYTNGRMSA